MTKLDKKVSSYIKEKLKNNKNISPVIETIAHHTVSRQGNIIQASIMRGKLIRYSQFMTEVEQYLDELKSSNPKYLDLLNQIIDIAIYEHPQYSVSIQLESILSKFNHISYYNTEILDFTREIIIHSNILTAKLFLASISKDIILDESLKKHFKAATPFIKNIANSITSLEEKEQSIAFINAIKILINPNADYKKIALLPKIKYVVDRISSKNHEIDITKIIYSKISHTEISERLKNMTKDVKSKEKSGKEVDCTDYLITNSL